METTIDLALLGNGANAQGNDTMIPGNIIIYIIFNVTFILIIFYNRVMMLCQLWPFLKLE
jgi:hypothetical protein